MTKNLTHWFWTEADKMTFLQQCTIDGGALTTMFLFCLPFAVLADVFSWLTTPPPAAAPTRLELAAAARRRYEEDIELALLLEDPDEREAALAGARERFRRRIAELSAE